MKIRVHKGKVKTIKETLNQQMSNYTWCFQLENKKGDMKENWSEA